MTLYLDGQLAGTATDQNAMNFAVHMTAGQLLPGNTARQFDGRIDEIAVYDRALDTAAVQRHYRAGTSYLLGNDVARELR